MKKIVILILVVLLVAAGVGAYVFGFNTATVTKENQVVVEDQGQTYVVRFVDPEGKPVPGVMTQLCDDTACTTLPSDEEGKVYFIGPEQDWELKMLKAPEGFAYVQGEKLPVEANQETVVTLTRE